MDCWNISAVVLLLLAAVAHAALTPQDYWKTKLPNTPMPAAIRDLLRPGVAVGVEVLANTNSSVLRKSQVKIYYDPHPGTTMHSMPDVSVFFLEKNLRPGTTMRLDFARDAPAVAFIPRGEASTIPFSTKKLPIIFSRFFVQPNSAVANTMTTVLQACEVDDSAEKSKYCATSLESMLDFAISILRAQNIRSISSEVVKDGSMKQAYAVATSPREEIPGNNNMACHPEPWPYAVFYCHVTPATRVYVVPLVGQDGARVNAVAVCHMDTSAWPPGHLAFQMVKVKPGTVPICHFLSLGTIMWTALHDG